MNTKPYEETLTITAVCGVRLPCCLNKHEVKVSYPLPLHYNNKTQLLEMGTEQERAAARDGAIAQAGKLIQNEGWLVGKGSWACPACRKYVEVKKDNKQSAPKHWDGD